MEEQNRGVWIFLAVILALACCCAAAFAAGSVGYLMSRPVVSSGVEVSDAPHKYSEYSAEVGRAPTLKIDNFAGSVTIHAGESDIIHVAVTKRASNSRQRERIEVQIDRGDNGLAIKTKAPSGVHNASVELEITAPADTLVEARTGAGSIDIAGLTNDVELDSGAGTITLMDVTGEIDAHSGAGSINARGARGPVHLDTGAGSIEYEGTPQGDCRFESGAGSITLKLPAELHVEVDLSTGIGTIHTDYDVAGKVSKGEVWGTIGSGGEGSISAHTGTGSINLIRR